MGRKKFPSKQNKREQSAERSIFSEKNLQILEIFPKMFISSCKLITLKSYHYGTVSI